MGGNEMLMNETDAMLPKKNYGTNTTDEYYLKDT